MRILKVPPEISITLGRFLRGQREVVCKVLNRLRDQMENRYEDYRNDRNTDDPNLFNYRLHTLDDDDNRHTLYFAIDDSMASGYLLIAAVSHRLGKFLL